MAPETLAWTSILLLGVWHGINPGMGWLFAVALGMQDRDGRAVWRALPPLAAGHGIAIAGTVIVAGALGMVVPPLVLRWVVAAVLIGVGIHKLVSSRHPRYGGMRVNARELTAWSALMASAHGAGLMVVPFVLAGSAPGSVDAGRHASHMAAMASGPGVETAVVATLVHTLGYLVVTGGIAFLVHERLGLRRLRRLWVNLDLVWAAALIATGALTLAPAVMAAAGQA